MDELRSTLEAAVEEHSTPEPVVEATPVASEPVEAALAPEPTSSDAPQIDAAPAEDRPKSIEEVAAQPVVEKPVAPPADRAPASWKGESKKVWETLPLNVRQEVIRREREITTGLSEASKAKQGYSQIQEVIQPHMDRINAVYGGNSIQAINNLLGVERTLMAGDPMAKAQLVANMVKHFNIDLRTLDAMLSGTESPPEVQQQSQLERLLEQKLAPFNQFLTSQQQREQSIRQQQEQEVLATVEAMANDPQYPYFNQVRNDMADLIDLSAKKGLYLSFPEAYTKAVRMNDDVFEAASTRNNTQAATQAALQAHQLAQKAKGAAVSVSGSPSGIGVNAGNPSDLRGTILSAFGDSGRL